MELRTVGGLHLVLFAPNELGIYAKPLGSDLGDQNQGAFLPVSPATVLRDSGAIAALNGPMFDVCAGQRLPYGNAQYAASDCDMLEYRHMDKSRGLDIRGVYPSRGLTFSVRDGRVTVLHGDQASGDSDIAIQTYPPLVENGHAVASSAQNTDRVWRSGIASMVDGRMVLAVGQMTMAAFASALVDAGAVWAGYMDGGGSSALVTTGGRAGSSEGRPVPSWIVVRKPSVSIGTWLAAGAAVATGLWLFWPRPSIARVNPTDEEILFPFEREATQPHATPLSIIEGRDKPKSDLMVGPGDITAFTPRAVRDGAKILVTKFRVPIPTLMALTETIAPLVGKRAKSVMMMPWVSRHGDQMLEISVSIPNLSYDDDETLIDELGAFGFRAEGEGVRWEAVVDRREPRPRENPGRPNSSPSVVCTACRGSGRNVDGTPGSGRRRCKPCKGIGFVMAHPPDERFRDLATRIANAEERFLANVMERGFTRDEAFKIMAVYRKLKLVKMDANGATLSVKHGAYWEPDVLRRALERSA